MGRGPGRFQHMESIRIGFHWDSEGVSGIYAVAIAVITFRECHFGKTPRVYGPDSDDCVGLMSKVEERLINYPPPPRKCRK